MNPEIVTPLDLCPNMTAVQLELFQAYAFVIRPSKERESQRIHPVDISSALPIYQPDNAKDFATDILDIESKLWKESSESESTRKERPNH